MSDLLEQIMDFLQLSDLFGWKPDSVKEDDHPITKIRAVIWVLIILLITLLSYLAMHYFFPQFLRSL